MTTDRPARVPYREVRRAFTCRPAALSVAGSVVCATRPHGQLSYVETSLSASELAATTSLLHSDSQCAGSTKKSRKKNAKQRQKEPKPERIEGELGDADLMAELMQDWGGEAAGLKSA